MILRIDIAAKSTWVKIFGFSAGFCSVLTGMFSTVDLATFLVDTDCVLGLFLYTNFIFCDDSFSTTGLVDSI
jgi:hypothetical protein